MATIFRPPGLYKAPALSVLVALLAQDGVRGSFQALTAPANTKPVGQAVFDLPTYAKSSVVAINAAAWVTENRLVFPAVSPFFQTDWPNPVPRRYPVQDHQQTRFQGLATTNPVPFNQTDWPVVRSVPRLHQDHWTQASPAVQIGLAPFRQTDWPVPKGSPPPAHPIPAQASPAVQIGLSPFRQTDWPVVRSVPRLHQDWYTEASPAIQIGVNPVPFKPYDWPTPRPGPVLHRDFWTQGSRALNVVVAPFIPVDFPNPLIARRLLPEVGHIGLSIQYAGIWQITPPTGETWTAATPAAESWTPVSTTAESWTVVTETDETWTPIPPNSESWT